MVKQATTRNWIDIPYSSFDDLRLYGRRYVAGTPATRSAKERRLPLVCLSTLAGNSDEFHTLATYLSTHKNQPRDVYCLDYRGRGRSQSDTTSSNYTPYVELHDIQDFLCAADIPRFHLLGSSRGGMNAMLLATTRAGSIAGVILNDIGPVLEPSGVARLMGQIASLRRPKTLEDAQLLMWEMYGPTFPALGEEDWLALTEIWFRRENGKFVSNYDPRMAFANRHLDLRKVMPDMWGQYMALLKHPLLIIRGENSDMLSRKTLEQMRTLNWRAKAVSVPGQGHAPLLRDAPSLKTIHAFLAQNDSARAGV